MKRISTMIKFVPGKLYTMIDGEDNQIPRRLFRTKAEDDHREAGHYLYDSPFVFLDMISRHNGKFVSMKILTSEGLVGWMEVLLFDKYRDKIKLASPP